VVRDGRRLVLALSAAAMIAAACTGGDDGTTGEGELVATVASYDLAAGLKTRFIVGLLTPDNLFVSGGSVDLRFFFLGEQGAEGQPELRDEAVATFLPLPGAAAPAGSGVSVGPASHGQGVYTVEAITFDQPGFWEVEATAELPSGGSTDRAPFQVLPEPQVPVPGDRAPRTENLTVGDRPPAAVDSRAAIDGEIPDPELHRTTIAEAVEAGRPVLAVFATPVYCESRFCGPVTDMVAGLAEDYGEVAEFVHIEIWHDFQELEINRAAADWLLTPDGDLTEPWVYLIGKDGRVLARWDNVATVQEIEPWLKRL
jgi:hypothetical protein